MLFSIFAWHYALQFLEGTSEGGDALETAFGSNLFQRVFGMLLHEGNALLLYAQAVDIVVEGRLLYMCKIVAQVGAVGAYMGGQFLDGKSGVQIEFFALNNGGLHLGEGVFTGRGYLLAVFFLYGDWLLM